MRVPARVVEIAPEEFVHLEYYEDAVKGATVHSKIDSIPFAIPSSDSPPHC